jgi:two-component system catabolic regulation response regulator CreB
MPGEVKPLILVVEDEPAIADTVLYALGTEGFDTEWVTRGTDAVRLVAERSPALVVLDIGLPDISGFDVCRAIRRTSQVPVVFLTARTGEVDTVLGLELGGDDYIEKPFSPRVLTARIRARLRRPAADDQPSGFELDHACFTVRLHGRELGLTRYEFGILKLLIGHPRRVYSREQLIELVWSEPGRSFDRTVDTHIKTIRQKIRAIAPNLDPIRTHRGIGYSFEP